LEGLTVTVEQTITLRDVARRLAPLRHSRDKVASDELLDLLKSGEITAGFRFPGCTILWIKIPVIYWVPFSSNKFRIIRHSSKKKNSGVLTVQLGEFAEDIVNQLNAQLENKKTKDLDEWKALLKATTLSYEVEITVSEWANYLNRHNLTEPDPEIKSKSGRHEKTGWRALSVIIGAYIIKHYQETHEHIKIEEASKKIYKLAEADKIPDLPAAPTIKEMLSKIHARAEKISIN
jgi:hypothetical protein